MTWIILLACLALYIYTSLVATYLMCLEFKETVGSVTLDTLVFCATMGFIPVVGFITSILMLLSRLFTIKFEIDWKKKLW
jgi:hypothetical protein